MPISLLCETYLSLEKLLNTTTWKRLYFQIITTARDLYCPIRNTIWNPCVFAGSWQCRRGFLLVKPSGILKSPSTARKELALSGLEGTSLNAFIKGQPDKFPKWLTPLEHCRTTPFQARFTRKCKQSCLNFCQLLFQVVQLWDFRLSNVKRENPLRVYYATASDYIIELFYEFSHLLRPYHGDFRLESISRGLFKIAQFIDCLYTNSGLLSGAECAFLRVPVLFPRSPYNPGNPVSSLLVVPKKGITRNPITAWSNITNSLAQVRILRYLKLPVRIEQSLSRVRKATGFSIPVIEREKRGSNGHV